MLVVLGFLILSYRETIKAYPTAGGAYMVTRDNFGLMPAQVAGVALLTDYVLTVAVSVAAGTAALVSAFPALKPSTVPISVAFICLIAFGNLRGVRSRAASSRSPLFLHRQHGGAARHRAHQHGAGTSPWPTTTSTARSRSAARGSGLLMGATLYVVLHAFASGGAAVTGVEAISNGVPAFRKPEWKNARSTLVVMGTLLGVDVPRAVGARRAT